MRILLITLISLLYFPLHGQQIIDEMAQLTCDCMSEKGVEGKTAAETEAIMQDCLISSLLPRLEDLQEQMNVEITDQVAMRGVGEKIGLKMVVLCPNIMMSMVGDKTEEAEESNTRIEGKITKIEGTDFTKITIEDEGGSIFKVLWLRSFEGDTQLQEMENDAIGKTVSVEFSEISCFSAEAKKYIAQKEIVSLSFK